MDTEEPDFTLDFIADLCSTAQVGTLEKLKANGWTATHLWERSPGEVCIWCLARMTYGLSKKIHPWVHCFIKPDGTIERYGK